MRSHRSPQVLLATLVAACWALASTASNGSDGGSAGGVCSRWLPWCDFPAELNTRAPFNAAVARLPALERRLAAPSAPPQCNVDSLVEYLCTEAALNLGEGRCRWPGYAGLGSAGVVAPGSPPGDGLAAIEFLNADVCGPRGFHGGLDPDVVFFYPVYKAPDMVALSINTLQHREHAFLVQVTAGESAEFVAALLSLAGHYANICVVRYGAVVYATGSQEMVQWPAMEWLLQLRRWRHYVLMCGQSLPLRGVRDLRALLQQHPSTSFLRHTRSEMDANRRNTQRIKHACLPFCKRHPEFRNLTMRRANALTDTVTEHWYKVGSWPVKVLARPFVEYAITSPQAFRLFHFFKYTYISNEHLLPTLFSAAGPAMWGTISDEWSSTLAIWPKLTMRNTVLTQAHEHLWLGKKILFARKFDPRVDHRVIQRLVHSHSPHIRMPWELPSSLLGSRLPSAAGRHTASNSSATRRG
eukprot:jgi/Tetstr1/462721/TSEL_007684.t1